MPVQFKQVISSFITQSAYKKLAVSAAWRVLSGFEVLMYVSSLSYPACKMHAPH
jgi:hypothetical protein